MMLFLGVRSIFWERSHLQRIMTFVKHVVSGNVEKKNSSGCWADWISRNHERMCDGYYILFMICDHLERLNARGTNCSMERGGDASR